MRSYINLFENPEVTTAAEAFEQEAEAALEVMSSHVSVTLFATDDREAELHSINSSTMRQGWGSKAMDIITALADKHQIVLTLEVDNDSEDDWGGDDWSDSDDDGEEEDGKEENHDPDRIPSNDDLISWYDRYGFSIRPSMKMRTQMIRQPKVAPVKRRRKTGTV